MKLTSEILEELMKNDPYFRQEANECKDRVQNAMIIYAELVRDEDRKSIARNVRMTGIAYGNDTSITDYEVDTDSIINAPKLELK